MRHTLIAALVLATALTGACSKNETASNEAAPAGGSPAAQSANASQTNLSPEQLGELGAKIEKSPDKANELLGEHGLTQKDFEQQIRKVTEDLQASMRFAEAYKKAKA